MLPSDFEDNSPARSPSLRLPSSWLVRLPAVHPMSLLFVRRPLFLARKLAVIYLLLRTASSGEPPRRPQRGRSPQIMDSKKCLFQLGGERAELGFLSLSAADFCRQLTTQAAGSSFALLRLQRQGSSPGILSLIRFSRTITD